jgi:hypothetical protein
VKSTKKTPSAKAPSATAKRKTIAQAVVNKPETIADRYGLPWKHNGKTVFNADLICIAECKSRDEAGLICRAVNARHAAE